MKTSLRVLSLSFPLILPAALAASGPISGWLQRPILSTNQTMLEVQAYTETRIPRMPQVNTVREWEKITDRLRRETLDRVVYRGEATRWRDAKPKVEWLETIEGGPGYHIRKLRYEALPGLWIPALLYEPEYLSGNVPVVLDVNGHEPTGKYTNYKQIRCINIAKRGMLSLNPEWLGMGQLAGPEYHHSRMNQIDLCGTSGLAPFYLAMKRGMDLLLSHEHADKNRAAIDGLSGGGWQSIYFGALDTRVALANPVAGYSSFITRIHNLSDLGDSEQTPCDMATVLDYTHMTGMRAPRPTLLTYNIKDDCCFASGHALPPLLEAAQPIFKLYSKPENLRSHVNYEPGTHNFERENREKFYQLVGDYFYAGDSRFSAIENPSSNEVKTAEQLLVKLPENNATFRTLALDLSKTLPLSPKIPTGKSALEKWQRTQRERLRTIVRAKDYAIQASKVSSEEQDGTVATFWRLNLGNDWTVPVTELSRGESKGTTILIADDGKKNIAVEAEKLLAAGQRVVAVDVFYFGEAKILRRDYLFALLVSTIGDRPLGLQASQLNAVARWSKQLRANEPVNVIAVGPRSSLIALVAAGVESKSIDRLEVRENLASLKDVIEKNWGVNEKPEMFCFGLLEAFDIPQLEALVSPRMIEKR